MFSFFMLYHVFFAFWKFLRLGNSAWDFLGVNFQSRDLLGVLGIFWGFDLCPHSIIPFTSNLEYPSWAHTYREFLEVTPQYVSLQVLNTLLQGSKLKKSSSRLLATNWRNIVTRCKFLVTSLCNVNESHSS